MNKGYYSASVLCGVEFLGDKLSMEADPKNLINAQTFLELLDSLESDAYIIAYFSEGDLNILEEIDNTYGIQC